MTKLGKIEADMEILPEGNGPIASDRRRLMKMVGAIALAGVSGHGKAANVQSTRRIKIGFVTPISGPLSAFGEADKFVIEEMRRVLQNGIKIGGKFHSVDILVRDTFSSVDVAKQAAISLIEEDQIDLMLVASSVDTINPVSDQCELKGVPCISSVNPWQSWFFGRGGKPDVGFVWTYHFFWGLEDVINVYIDMWKSIKTNSVVGAMFPIDPDGEAWSDPNFGFPPAIAKAGFKFYDVGHHLTLSYDFSSQIAALKAANCDIVTGNMIPRDVKTFWAQARQRGYKPKVLTIGKGLLFPTAVEAMGNHAEGLSTEVWWSPTHPFKSSLTGQSAAQLAASYEAKSNKQWTQPLGFSHALFEVAVDVLRRSSSIDDKVSIRNNIASTDIDTIVGRVSWNNSQIKNVAKTPLVGGQWVKGKKHSYDLIVVENSRAPVVPLGGKLMPIP